MELKKCKFCGHDGVVYKDDEFFGGKYYACCIYGDCRNEHIKEIPCKPFDTEEEAVKWWNDLQESK